MKKDCSKCSWKPFDKDTCMINANRACDEVKEEECQFDPIPDHSNFEKIVSLHNATKKLREDEQLKSF